MSSPRSRKTINLQLTIPGLQRIEEVNDEVRTLRTNIEFQFASQDAASDFNFTFNNTPSYRTAGSAWAIGNTVRIKLREKDKDLNYRGPSEFYQLQDVYRALHEDKQYCTAADRAIYENQLKQQAEAANILARKKTADQAQILARIPGFSHIEIVHSFGAEALEITFNQIEDATAAHYDKLLPSQNSGAAVFTTALFSNHVRLRTIPVERYREGIDTPTTIDEIIETLGKLYPAPTAAQPLTVRENKTDEYQRMETPYQDAPEVAATTKPKSNWMKLFSNCWPGSNKPKSRLLDEQLLDDSYQRHDDDSLRL